MEVTSQQVSARNNVAPRRTGKTSKKQALMDATIDLVAEGRLENFSCNKAAVRAGCTERLLFMHFGTKENLLHQCYREIDDEIAHLFERARYPIFEDMEDLSQSLKSLWITYFRFLVRGGNRTLFYFEYRNSDYMNSLEQMERELSEERFHYFANFFQDLDNTYRIGEKISYATFWTYFLDMASSFSTRIIKGALPDTKRTYDEVWRLFSKGLLELLN